MADDRQPASLYHRGYDRSYYPFVRRFVRIPWLGALRNGIDSLPKLCSRRLRTMLRVFDTSKPSSATRFDVGNAAYKLLRADDP